MSLFRQLLHHQCILCLAKSSDYICQDCLSSLPRVEHACFSCGLPLEDSASHCRDCLQQPKPYTLTISPLLYSHPVDALVQQFKERTPQAIAEALCSFLQPHIDHHYTVNGKPELLIPVPMHWTRQFKRGFNQAHCLAEALSTMTNIPCRNISQQRASNRNQKILDRRQRQLNLRHAFFCKESLKGCHVTIVDDVVTSCATVINLSKVLIGAGASRVDVWALARTPKQS